MADRHDPRATWTMPRGELLLQHFHSPTEIQLNATTTVRPHGLLSAAYLHWQGHGVRWAWRCIIARSRVVRSTLGHQRRILRAPPSRRDRPCCTVARPRIEATHHRPPTPLPPLVAASAVLASVEMIWASGGASFERTEPRYHSKLARPMNPSRVWAPTGWFACLARWARRGRR